MNIFVLDTDPVLAAQMHCDKHVVKMILETAQILSTVWHELPEGAHYAIPAEAYRPTHRNHPCVKWAGRSSENYLWLVALGEALLAEFLRRYGHGHKTDRVIKALSKPPACVSKGPRTPFVCCMPDEFIVALDNDRRSGNHAQDVVQSYRDYYRMGKAHLLRYTNRQQPDWLNS